MANSNNRIFKVEDAHITYRNFKGEARQYNKEGNRNFNVILTPDQAKMFSDEGFRVRERSAREEDGDPVYLMSVSVSFRFRPPRVVVIRGKSRVELDEDTIGELDYADIEYIDMTIRPYYWSMPDGKCGVKAYLNSMYVTLVDDPFEDKYADEESEEEPF